MDWRECDRCGYGKWLAPGETTCPPCADRAAKPEPAGKPLFGGGLTGRRALAMLEGQLDDQVSALDRTRERYRARDAVTDGDTALRWLGENAVVTVVTVRHRYRG